VADKKYVGNVDVNQLETCYPPIIQSGGKYSLKFSATRWDEVQIELIRPELIWVFETKLRLAYDNGRTSMIAVIRTFFILVW
jgi:nucleosome binding factor SPN SPT16 subunit